MQIEAGKYYKTRDGRKAYVDYVFPSNVSTDNPCVGWVTNEPRTWAKDGSYFTGSQGDLDLVSEWREPVSFERQVILHKDGACMVRIGEYPDSTFLGRWKVRITEGQGIEVIE